MPLRSPITLPKPMLVVDFETYYDTEYSLRRLSNNAYIKDPRFHAFGAGVAFNDEPAFWVDGDDLDHFFSQDLSRFTIIGHNLAFDGLILTQKYGVNPGLWVDTLGMARAVLGSRTPRLGLDHLSKLFGLGGKRGAGAALNDMRGVRHPTPVQYAALAAYGVGDAEDTRTIAHMLATQFPVGEYQILDWTMRMAVNPRLLVDPTPLHQLKREEAADKEAKIAKTGYPKSSLSSNPRFAELLRTNGVEPPTKVSLRTGKETFAFSKGDEVFLDLLDHPDDKIHDLVTARLAVKSTINESRAERFLQAAKVGAIPAILQYSGAMQTHRLSGGGGDNMQNLPRGSLLRTSLVAPPGMKVVSCDLAQIELRGNCLAAGQHDLLSIMRERGDVYLNFAKLIYHNPNLTKADKAERNVGKIGELSLGYYSGAFVFKAMLRGYGIRVDMDEAQRIVKLYRQSHAAIRAAWNIYGEWLEYMGRGEVPRLGRINAPVELMSDGFRLPSGLIVSYPDMRRWNFTEGHEVAPNYVAGPDEQVGWSYFNTRAKNNRAKLHAGVFNNNLIQSVCRDVNFHATKQILNGLRDIDPTASVVLSVHDETVCLAQEDKAEAVEAFMLDILKTPPTFWPDLPVDAEGGIGPNFGAV